MSRKLPAWCQSQREKVLTNATSSGYAGISASEINTCYNAIKLNQISKVREFIDKYPHALYIKVCSSTNVHFLSHHLHSLYSYLYDLTFDKTRLILCSVRALERFTCSHDGIRLIVLKHYHVQFIRRVPRCIKLLFSDSMQSFS